jgi:putative transposase
MNAAARGADTLASVIIPCFNQLEFTRLCVPALVRCTRPPWELIAVDNGSTDGTAAYFSGMSGTAPMRVEVVTNTTNRGFPAACNQGLKAARGAYLVGQKRGRSELLRDRKGDGTEKGTERIIDAPAATGHFVAMPRTARASVGGIIYHALNRGNRRADVFHKPADYDAFVDTLAEARQRLPVDLFSYCLMPNHFHLVIRPRADGELGLWMRWLLTTHAQRYHRHYKTSGHVWQGRFKAFPIQDEDHLATVLRYVERNPVRAELVARAEHWKWSSLPRWLAKDPLLWRGEPVVRDAAWLKRVNAALSASDLQRLRLSVARERPFGDDAWTRRTAERLGLEFTLRDRGRPKKS